MDDHGSRDSFTLDTPPPDEPEGDGFWDDLPESLQPRRRLPKWPFVVASLILILGIALALAWPINLPYYAMSPGPVNDASDFVKVDEPLDDATGDLFFLTVSLKEVNVLEWVGAKLDSRVDLAPRENIRPVGVSQEDLRRENLALMERSKQNAIFVALTRLGYEVTYVGSGAEVNSVVAESAADGHLEPGDVIVAVDGEPVEFSTEAVDLIGGHRPGDRIELTVHRPVGEDGTETETLTVPIVLGPFRAVEDDGSVTVDENRGMVGVTLMDADVQVVFPVDVEIDSRNIGGPSAGMMFTLEIMDELTPTDLTDGHRIAGTGTIDQDGVVGAIGGVRQKVYGAIDAGAEYVLVPTDNYDDAVDAAGDDIGVVAVGTIDDALGFLDTL
jgi:PDZ domain-containing protein